ncbi:unnamed protein product, partial [Polarella glacialis]
GQFRLLWHYTLALGLLTAGDALGPVMVAEWPLVLLVLNANDLHLGLTAPVTHWLPWHVIGTLRRLAEDPVFFAIGWYYSDQGLAWLRRRSPSSAKAIEKASATF